MINEKTSIEELGAIVCQRLKNEGVDAFLSGGAVVSIYTNNKYESFDLDFISFGSRKKIKLVMIDLGFIQDVSRLYIHPQSKYFVEFPGNSTEIGDEKITEFSEKIVKGNILILLTPTDCVKDRLAATIHWNDQQGLVQAVSVACSQPVVFSKIEKFCKSEGSEETYLKFMLELSKAKR